MKLVIAEKPSVAQSIAKVIGAYERKDGYLEGSGYIVSWCVGHLVELAQADAYNEAYKKWNYEQLPIVPDQWKYEVAASTKKQFYILKELMKREDVTELVESTDAGREGELIFRLVYHMAGCKKPFSRLWISSMEDDAIREGFENLKPGTDYDALYEAAVCRTKADWLVGINGTRLLSTIYLSKIIVGRVLSVVLSMADERSWQIETFQKQKYFNIHLDLDGMDVVLEKVFEEEKAKQIQGECDGNTAVVTEVKTETKRINPPKLYDLTTLQREANRYYGYTAQKTLDYTQSLYEKKLVTYPRTDSQYLSDDMGSTAQNVISAIYEIMDDMAAYRADPVVDRVLDSKKVTDHHAIIPTVEIRKQDLSELTFGERDILKLIAQRLLCATATVHQYGETNVTVECAGNVFGTKGRKIVDPGWKSIEDAFKATLKEKSSKDAADKDITAEQGSTYSSVKSVISEHFTTPPKQYTEDTLLAAMEKAGNEDFDDDTEKKGIGTPATRAAIIEKLVANGYLERKGKQLIPTKSGHNVVVILPDVLKSPKLTAEWENTLMRIERREADGEEFLSGITKMVSDLVDQYHGISEEEKSRFAGMRKEKEVIGTCPRCGKPVYESEKSFYCSNRECNFTIWKESKFLSSMKKKVTKSMAASLLKSGKVNVKGLYSQKKDKTFDATLVLDDTGSYVNFKLEFPKGEKKHEK